MRQIAEQMAISCQLINHKTLSFLTKTPEQMVWISPLQQTISKSKCLNYSGQQITNKQIKTNLRPGLCAQWLEHQPVHRSAMGLIPGQEHIPRLWVLPLVPVRVHVKGNQSMCLLSLMFFSLSPHLTSLQPPPILFEKQWKKYHGWGFQEQTNKRKQLELD